MLDIILTLALIALTAISLLYITGCDRLQADGSESSTSATSSSSKQGR
jgi:hypothetical protein